MNLSKTMHHLNNSYTTYINIKRKRSGHLFQGRYKAILVDRDSYLLELSRYLHLNPVRANMVERPEEYPHSSYGAYIAGGDELVTTAAVRSMISADTATAKQKYKAFVESVLGEKLESPMKNIYGGMILGNVPFIKETLNRLEDDHLQKAEASHKKALRASCEVDEVLSVAAKYYGVTVEITTNPQWNGIRKSCIYLMKRRTTASNREIGEILGGMSGFAVAKAYQRMVAEMKQDAALRKEIERLENKLSRVKGCPLGVLPYPEIQRCNPGDSSTPPSFFPEFLR